MKKLLHITFAIFLLLNFTVAQAQITRLFSKLSQPEVTILRTDPVQPVEGTMVTVYFKFNNPGTGTLNGWIGAEMNSGTRAPVVSPVDWPVKDLSSQQFIYGAIMIPCTNAGIQKKLRVFFYDQQQPSNQGIPNKSQPRFGIGETDINVATLVYFRLNTFTVDHTRANSTDTDWGSLYATVNDQPTMQPVSVYMGPFDGGSHPFGGTDVNDKPIVHLQTGPMALVPGINSSIHIIYTMYNGGGIANSKAFLEGYAQATANPELFHGPRPGTDKAIEVLKKLILPLSAIGYCDGFVVYKDIVIQSNELFNNPANFTQSIDDRFNTEEFASQTGCGSTSNYAVSASFSKEPISTLFQQANAMQAINLASHPSPPVFMDITGNRTLNVGQNAVSWQRVETINGNGNFTGLNDPTLGYLDNNIYHSPAQIDKPQLVVLHGTMQNAGGEISLNTLGEQLKQVTAIVQLVPGMITVKNQEVATIPETNTSPTMIAKPPPQKETEGKKILVRPRKRE